MAKNAKGKAKAAPVVDGAAVKSKASQTPAPFVFPEEKMKPFLELLDPKHIYITHIDEHPTNFKLQLFCVPVFMNTVLIALLLVRAYTIAPYYWQLILTLAGVRTQYWIDVPNTGWNVILDETVQRTLTLVLDLFLLRFVGQWPYDFLFARPASPCAWRWALGFRRQEIAVRRSRPWDAALPRGWLREEAGDDGGAWGERIMPALDRTLLRTKSAYMLLDKHWDLDFHGMIQAHALVDARTLQLDDLQKQVLVYAEEHGGWLVWPVWKLDEKEAGGDGDGGSGRQKIVAFKDKLTAMGKENLFFRWIEVIQYESSQPGGFTEERQASAMREARRLFEDQGVDFDKFWKEVGGMDGMPGLEKQA